MKYVYIVTGWTLGETEFIWAVFENESETDGCIEILNVNDEYGYQYFYKQWEVK